MDSQCRCIVNPLFARKRVDADTSGALQKERAAEAARSLTRLLGNGPGGAGPFPQVALYRLPLAETQPQVFPHDEEPTVGVAKGALHGTSFPGLDAPA
jgi:hypothetical protein